MGNRGFSTGWHEYHVPVCEIAEIDSFKSRERPGFGSPINVLYFSSDLNGSKVEELAKCEE